MGTKAAILTVAAALAVSSAGCDSDLDQAFSDVRAAAPGICSDFCVEEVDCEWPYADGAERENAFSGAIRGCIVECAFIAAEGAYVYVIDPEQGGERSYVDSISGTEFTDTLECLVAAGAFFCPAEAPYEYQMSPRNETECAAADACFAALGVDHGLRWTPIWTGGGVCEKTGAETVDVPYFNQALTQE